MQRLLLNTPRPEIVAALAVYQLGTISDSEDSDVQRSQVLSYTVVNLRSLRNKHHLFGSCELELVKVTPESISTADNGVLNRDLTMSSQERPNKDDSSEHDPAWATKLKDSEIWVLAPYEAIDEEKIRHGTATFDGMVFHNQTCKYEVWHKWVLNLINVDPDGTHMPVIKVVIKQSGTIEDASKVTPESPPQDQEEDVGVRLDGASHGEGKNPGDSPKKTVNHKRKKNAANGKDMTGRSKKAKK